MFCLPGAVPWTVDSAAEEDPTISSLRPVWISAPALHSTFIGDFRGCSTCIRLLPCSYQVGALCLLQQPPTLHHWTSEEPAADLKKKSE